MCGIFAYAGDNAVQNIVNGLKRLEYRGYDSWGLAIAKDGRIEISKQVGSIKAENPWANGLECQIGIGHTRWATHGQVNVTNAQPHFSSDHSFALAQNGIVENYQALKNKLKDKGYQFITETDTEVIVRLIEDKLKIHNNLSNAVRQAFVELQGRNTIVVIPQEGRQLIAVRQGSPLVLGIGDDQFFCASDVLSFADQTQKVIFVNDGQMVEYTDGKIRLSITATNKDLPIKIEKLNNQAVKIDQEGFEHFMLKEIAEQPKTIRQAVQYTAKELSPLVEAIKQAGTVYTVGSGTASYVAQQAAYYLRAMANIQAIPLKAYDVDSYAGVFKKDDLIIAFSQSGETADTIEALTMARAKGARLAALVNMVGSTMSRMADWVFYTRSGPEICVASTKVFTAMCAWSYLLAGAASKNYQNAKTDIETISANLETYLSKPLFDKIQQLSKIFKKPEHFFVLGRGQNFAIALEGALKVKEISYKHFEGFTAGELKHGIIALIEPGVPVFCLISDDDDRDNMLSAASEVKARGALLVGIGQVNNEIFDHFIPVPGKHLASSVVNTIPFQLISYYLALQLGRNIDKPRNLAKSVTVK